MRDSSGTRRCTSFRSVNTEIKWELKDEEREERTTVRGESEYRGKKRKKKKKQI